MNRFTLLTVLGFIAALTTACGKTYPGTLVTKDQQPLVINHDEGRTAVTPGTMKVTLKNGGILGDAVIDLKTLKGKKLATITLPKGTAAKALRFQLSPNDINQNFGLLGHQTSSAPVVTTRQDSEGCTKCDFCNQTVSTTDSNNQPTTTTQYAYNCACSGSQDVLKEDTSIVRQVMIDFVQGNSKIAMFTSKPFVETTTRKLHDIGSCD
ncbi:MAG: hypothetical protein V4736_14375 [Bdellovibrionota bacterium]